MCNYAEPDQTALTHSSLETRKGSKAISMDPDQMPHHCLLTGCSIKKIIKSDKVDPTSLKRKVNRPTLGSGRVHQCTMV